MSPNTRAVKSAAGVSDRDYARLLAVRTGLRRFERWSAQAAAEQGLTPNQHQLLLAVRGDATPEGPTIGQVAQHLLIQPHSALELAHRAEQAGLVVRVRDRDDHRVVRLQVSAQGERILAALSTAHAQELARLGPLFASLSAALTSR